MSAIKHVNVINDARGEWWSIYQADCVSFQRQLPDECIDFSIHSPPFANLYTYSDALNDMGNCVDDKQFFEQYRFLVREKLRTTRPGRLCAVHCKQLVDYRGRDGRAGLRDFRGEIIRVYEEAGWKYHSEVTIWTDPVLERARTNAHGLLYKQLRADSSFSRQGLAEYVCVFRKWASDDDPNVVPVTHTEEDFTLNEWQQIASPVWVLKDGSREAADGLPFTVPVEDIRRTDVLNVAQAREDKDEKHMCPLQLSVVERAVRLWSNPGDVVQSDFAGIGSEGVGAMRVRDGLGIRRPRRFIGTELKESYFNTAIKNLKGFEPDGAGQTVNLFDWLNSKKGAPGPAVDVSPAPTPPAETPSPARSPRGRFSKKSTT